jgi:hypothetical protein
VTRVVLICGFSRAPEAAGCGDVVALCARGRPGGGPRARRQGVGVAANRGSRAGAGPPEGTRGTEKGKDEDPRLNFGVVFRACHWRFWSTCRVVLHKLPRHVADWRVLRSHGAPLA